MLFIVFKKCSRVCKTITEGMELRLCVTRLQCICSLKEFISVCKAFAMAIKIPQNMTDAKSDITTCTIFRTVKNQVI